jgi:hypothetical protein
MHNKTNEIRIRTAIDNKLFITGSEVEHVESFIYLGSVVTKSAGAEEMLGVALEKQTKLLFSCTV